MATESLFPDGEVGTTTNFSGTFTNVDDTQASPGSDWIDPTVDGNNNEVTFSMQLPSGDLNTGSGLQTLKLHIRKQVTGGTDPTFNCHIREAGNVTDLATLVTNQSITSDTGEDFTFTFDAAVLSAVSGADLEVHFFGNRSGGSGPNRRNLSIGAVEWVADYSTTSTITGSGTLTSQSAAMSGTSELEHTASGALVSQSASMSGTSEIIKTGSGSLISQAAAVAGVAAILFAASGSLNSQSASMSGSAEDEKTGSGILLSQSASMSGTAELEHIGSGVLISQSATLSGTATVEGAITGSGVLISQSATTGGTAEVEQIASGAIIKGVKLIGVLVRGKKL